MASLTVKVPEYAPWALHGYANLMEVLTKAKALHDTDTALPDHVNAIIVSLNTAINTMRPGNLAELEDLNELLDLLRHVRAFAEDNPTPAITEAISYADMVVKYVSDGSGTIDMIKNAEKRLNKLFTK